jgi:hypothetical protein
MREAFVGQWIGDLKGTVFGPAYFVIVQDGDTFPASLSFSNSSGGVLKFKGSLEKKERVYWVELEFTRLNGDFGSARIDFDRITENEIAGRWVASTGDEGVIFLQRVDTVGGRLVPRPAPAYDPTIKIAPISRVSMTFARELALDKEGLFNEDRYKNYTGMLQQTEQKRDNLVRTIIVCDALVVLLLLGKTIKIPGMELSLAELPGATEALTVLSTLAFFFLATTMINWNAYSLIIDQFNIRKAEKSGIDPDFLSASDKYTEFWLKIYRRKFNIWNFDFFVPRRGFIALSYLVSTCATLVIISMLGLHITVIGAACRTIYNSEYSMVLKLSLLAFICITNLCGSFMQITAAASFKFDVGKPDPT